MKRKVVIFLLIVSNTVFGQSESSVDASKPTNLYTQINSLLEYQLRENGPDVYGTRLNIQYAFNPDNLLLAELPLLYNSGTEKFGVSDTRLRYFNVVKRGLTKKIIALAPYADVTIPTGNFSKGLGSSVWSLSAGCVVGLAISEKIGMFPGAGYIYITEPLDYFGTDAHGFNVQTNMSISFTKRAFLFVNPIFTYINSPSWSGELNFNYMVKPSKFKLNAGYFPNFTSEIHTFRIGATFFL